MCGRRRQGVNRPGDVPAGQRKGASLVPQLAIPVRSPHREPVCEPHDSTGEPGALCCVRDYVAKSTDSPIAAGDGAEVRHIMRKAYRAARKDSNSLFACQFGVCSGCSGRGSEPKTAHVCNAFAFISRSTSA